MTQISAVGVLAPNDLIAKLKRLNSEAREETGMDDPLLAAIKAYRDGMAAYNAAPADDEETVERTYGAPLDVLMDWEEPAQTREGAMAALRLALQEEREFKAAPLATAMLQAALDYFENAPR
ncbi:hypothetical protein [Sinorhizobium meliloti]|uniref:hypothetical protein n=1 Tax=Rhizobium meliloti TaxID=382 RepID=UPI00040B8E22|nr:hypothetical protein [Sinorhizobium meliloti]MDE4620631.1 hypothetical protein [Sinorhizobium meliloti]